MTRSEILMQHEYERIQSLAGLMASLSKRGLAGYDTLPVNDHIRFLHEIERVCADIQVTVQGDPQAVRYVTDEILPPLDVDEGD